MLKNTQLFVRSPQPIIEKLYEKHQRKEKLKCWGTEEFSDLRNELRNQLRWAAHLYPAHPLYIEDEE